MTNYVVGFMFSEDLQFVALIRKNRPKWQAGKLNGIGGHMEGDESPRAAMIREFREETGVDTQEDDWTLVGRLEGENAKVYVCRCISNKVMDVQTTTDEKVLIYCTDPVPEDVVPNLKAIIPALLLPDLTGLYFTY